MDTIRMYLDNMFLNLPQSTKVLQAKEELLSMMEDKYNELKAAGKTENEAVGIVIAEFGNLEEAAAELGITSEVAQRPAAAVEPEEADVLLSNDVVEKYLSTVRTCCKKVALGVLMCICAPIPLILLGGLGELNAIALDEDAGGLLGMIILMVMVAAAVVLFILNGTTWEKFDYLKKQNIRLQPSMHQRIRSEQEAYQPVYMTRLCVGVGLCILSVIPLFLVQLMSREKEVWAVISVGIFLVLVAIGVYLLIVGSGPYDAYALLLQEGEYAPSERRKRRLTDAIAPIYWSVVTAIYLGWSFFTMAWDTTWLVWPVAGVLFGAVAAVCTIIDRNRKPV